MNIANNKKEDWYIHVLAKRLIEVLVSILVLNIKCLAWINTNTPKSYSFNDNGFYTNRDRWLQNFPDFLEEFIFSFVQKKIIMV